MHLDFQFIKLLFAEASPEVYKTENQCNKSHEAHKTGSKFEIWFKLSKICMEEVRRGALSWFSLYFSQ